MRRSTLFTPEISSIDALDANWHMVSAHKCGFFLCQAGWAKILLGSKVYHIKQHSLCVYTPNTLFQILERSHDLDGIIEVGSFEDYYQPISVINIKQRLFVRNEPCVTISPQEATRLEQLQSMVHNHGMCGDETTDSLCVALIQQLKYALCLEVLRLHFKNCSIMTLPQHSEDVILNKFIVAVYTHYMHNRTVQFYAKLQHLSPYYFSTIIKRRSGRSALQWITSITMTIAKQLLNCSNKSIKEIAEILNFPDQSTFGRFFKHHAGCSPMAYRTNTP